MQPARRCLSPMAEESCEEMDWSESPLAQRRRGEAEAEAQRRRGEVQEEGESSTSKTSHGEEDREEKKTYSESLPVESRLREGTDGKEETCSASLPVESRAREDVKMEVTSSESLPVESRIRCDVNRIDESSESLPVESRVRCDAGEEKVVADSLPIESRLSSEQVDCDMTYSESLPVESRVRGEGCTGKDVTNGLSDESMTSSDESVKNESRSLGKEAAESGKKSGRVTRHRTSWSLPNEAVKYDFKTSFISKMNGSPSNNGQTSNGVTRVSWSLPNEARVRETTGNLESVTENLRKGDPDSCVPTRVSSPSNETRNRESRRKKINVASSSLPNEARIKEKGSESLPNEARIKEKGRESLPNEARLRQPEDGATKTASLSIPNETTRKDTDQTVGELSSSSPNRLRAGGNNGQSKAKPLQSLSKDKDERLSQDSKETVGNHVRNTVENAKEENKVEVIDRTEDKKYNFSALRMKRKQAQLAAKNRKDSATKTTSSRQSKKSAASSETKTNSSTSSSTDERRDGRDNKSTVTSHPGEKCHSSKTSVSATMKSGGSDKNSDQFSPAPRSKTAQEIIEDLEGDTSWRTTRSTDSKEDNTSHERLGESNPTFTLRLAGSPSLDDVKFRRPLAGLLLNLTAYLTVAGHILVLM